MFKKTFKHLNDLKKNKFKLLKKICKVLYILEYDLRITSYTKKLDNELNVVDLLQNKNYSIFPFMLVIIL